MSLTTTQHSALGDLRRFGRLFPTSGKLERGTVCGFSRRTLQALVDQGFAEWEGDLAAAIVPASTWLIVQDEDGDHHTVCPKCGATDTIVEVDRAVRWNTLDLSDYPRKVNAILGNEDQFDFDDWHCTGCDADGLNSPEGFQIGMWF